MLIVVVSKKEFEYNGRALASVTHQFDIRAAWENLALEASSRGLVAHSWQVLIMRKLEKI
jgi:hypothetical protein